MLIRSPFWKITTMLKQSTRFRLRSMAHMLGHRTLDKEATDVYAPTRLGRTQALTPEGFLLCQDVPIKRTGTMMYAPGEVPIQVGRDGVAHVTRDAAALFSPETVASYSGKAVTDDHPSDDVTPNNWKQLARGIVLNPRRGDGHDSDVMLADLLIMDAATIRDVQAGKREVSAGYSADYEQTGEGEGRQTHIIGNHVALVTRGRCGPRCSIGDHDPSTTLKGTNTMATTKARPRVKLLAGAIRKAFNDAGDNLAESLAGDDVDGLMADDDTEGGTHIHIHGAGDAGGPAAPGGDGGGSDDPVEARFQSLEQGHQQIIEQITALTQAVQAMSGGGGAPAAAPAAPGGEGPPTKDGADDLADGAGDTKEGGAGPVMATKDSAALATSFQATLADAEILVPGFRMPTFDAALPRAKTVDNMCSLRRSVLDRLMQTHDGVKLLGTVADGGQVPDLAKLPCDEVGAMFKAAAVIKKASNNRAVVGDGLKIAAQINVTGRAPSPADLNKANAEFWAKHAAGR